MADTMTVQTVRDYVRGYFDLDSTDLPDLMVDRWISEGWTKIVRYRPNWPGFQATVALAVTATLAEYPSPLKDIESVEGPDRYLIQMSPTEAERRFVRGGVADPAGVPVAFSVYAGKVRLWPVPSVTRNYTLRGQRAGVNPLNSPATDPIDLPTPDAVEMLLAWTLARAAVRQSELDTAEVYKMAFVEGMQLLAKDETDTNAFVPIVLNSLPAYGRNGLDSYMPDRLRFQDGWD